MVSRACCDGTCRRLGFHSPDACSDARIPRETVGAMGCTYASVIQLGVAIAASSAAIHGAASTEQGLDLQDEGGRKEETGAVAIAGTPCSSCITREASSRSSLRTSYRCGLCWGLTTVGFEMAAQDRRYTSWHIGQCTTLRTTTHACVNQSGRQRRLFFKPQCRAWLHCAFPPMARH